MTGEINREKISERDATKYVKGVERELKRSTNEIPADARQRIESLCSELRNAISEKNSSLIYKRYLALKVLANDHLFKGKEKTATREYFEAIGLAILFALIIRAFVFEAFEIPSGSMIPTLEIGDHLFVNKFVYGIRIPFTDHYLVRFSKPQPGEVVVFTFPNEDAKAYLKKQPHAQTECISEQALNEKRDFIKRIIGVEGDTVELRNNHLYVNGIPLKHTRISQEMLKSIPKNGREPYIYPLVKEREVNNGQVYTVRYQGKDPNFGPVKVADGHVFVMGDNRDESADSRCWGQVPVENIKGRAMSIFWSGFNRLGRIGHSIHESAEN